MNHTNNRSQIHAFSHWTRACLAALATTGLTGVAVQAQTVPPMPATPPVSPNPVVNYEYDAVGNPTVTVVAPSVPGLNLTTKTVYDNLYRPKTNTDPKLGVVTLDYNGADHLTKVTDPRKLVTQYPRNGLGDSTQLISPDTGTANHTFDAAGNVKTRTDSRGVLFTYSYDALNRLTSVLHSKAGASNETHRWTYDQTGAGFANGVNRLTSTTHPNGSTQYEYDPQGRVLTDTQRINPATGANSTVITRTVNYSYNAAGQVNSITYPSGRKLTFAYNSGGQPTSLALAKDGTSTATALISNIQWEPFGAPKSWNWQMSSGLQTQTWSYDTNARLIRYRLADLIRDLRYDEADRLTSYTHYDANTGGTKSAFNQNFTYDELGRLKTATVGTSSWSFNYDPNGNRTTTSLNGTGSTYTTPATNNRLTATTSPTRSISYDNAGNPISITGDPASSYGAGYNLPGRLSSLTKAGATTTYAYDVNGRRIRKFISAGTGAGAASTVLFAYDQNDQLIGEYDSTGKALREYVWLGNVPVAIFLPDPAVATNPPLVYYIQTDHLNTPRIVFNKSNQIRWRWLADPFGTAAPETNPSSLGVFTQPLRFPGQYADVESGLYYNHWRYFDPATGRYTQSDPIGLAGGGFSPYAYVGGNPLSGIDPNGLYCTSANGATTCSYPGGAMFSVRTPAGGFPSSLQPSDWLYHKYLVEAPLEGADAKCVMQKMIENPTPGDSLPATPEGTANNAKVFGLKNAVTSYSTVDLKSGAPVVVNMTSKGSVLADGYVARTVTNGVARTMGEGTNWKQSPYLTGFDTQFMANQLVWRTQMQRFIEECKCGK